MADGNKRYLGDVFINAENMERQKQFFKDIIESYQWKFGGSFDASTLQGFGASDFATKEQGDKADRALLGPINLGQQPIISITDRQYIYTDAVKLDRTETDILNSVAWFDELKNTEEDDVTHALEALYRQTLEGFDLKVDQTSYDDFINNDYGPFKRTLSNAFEIFEDWDGEEQILLNSDLTNGLRFILITQQEYDELPEAKKTFWRNIFIIKDASEIPADYHSPLQFDLTDGYEFAINDGYLQVKNVSSTHWKNICSLTELLSGTNFDEIISNFLITNDDYLIDEIALFNSLQTISTNMVNSDWESIPFLSSSLHDDFVENITINGSSDNVTTSIDSGSKFKKVDLDINNILQSSLSPFDESISSLTNSLEEKSQEITDLDNYLKNIVNPKIETLENSSASHDSELASIGETLQSLDSNIKCVHSALRDLTEGIGKWKSYTVPNLSELDGSNTVNYYNETLQLAYVTFHFSNYYKSIPKNTWRTPCKTAGGTVFPYTVVKAAPASQLAILNKTHTFFSAIAIDHLGRILVKVDHDITDTKSTGHTGTAFYKIRKIYEDDELTKIHNKLNSKKDSKGLYLIDKDYTSATFEAAYK